MKKGFTLIEILISIAIFSILMVFLYKTLDQTRFSNSLFKEKKNILESKNKVYKIFLKDILEASKIIVTKDKNNNSVLKLVTNNTYHNSNYNNITYLIDYSKVLVRIESQNEFMLYKTADEFYKSMYVDQFIKDVEIFKVVKNDSNVKIAFKEKDKKIKYFSIFTLLK